MYLNILKRDLKRKKTMNVVPSKKTSLHIYLTASTEVQMQAQKAVTDLDFTSAVSLHVKWAEMFSQKSKTDICAFLLCVKRSKINIVPVWCGK